MHKDSIDEGREARRAVRQARREARRSDRVVTSQVLMGVLVIAIGLLFLLDNLDIIEVRQALAFWPLVFIFAGVAKLLDTNSPNGYLVGLAGIGIGTAMILNRLGIIDFSWRAFWPLVLIAVGAMVVYRAMTGSPAARAGIAVVDDKDRMTGADDTATVDVTAILGGFERRVHSQDFRGGEVTAVMGGCTLDMRGASIRGEAVINVFAFWGGVTIKCPPDWTIILQGTPIMGGFEEKTVSPPDSSKRLVIRGYAIMGGVEVRN
ncbi:LiaI-LiaF-like domain-containing protein [Massilia sp. GCM10023247]|uniref:LiaI-LiaF-like domain-containing protein n=1 Tax=Massilia sp. GCM10023247 TaxID=3252643 RepID=UPI00361145AC